MSLVRLPLLLLATILTACGTTRPSRDEAVRPPESRRVSASGWVVSADDVRVRYHQSGRGPVAIVLVHGWLCDSRYWRLQVPALEQQYRVVTLDLAGHGESGFGREAWTIQAFAQDVAAVVHALGAERVILVGHSMGGPVVIEVARLADAVIGVIGVETLRAVNFAPASPSQREQVIASLTADFAGATRDLVSSSMFVAHTDPALRESIVADMVEGPAIVGIGALEGLLDYQAAEGLARLEVPFVLINADYAPTDTDLIRSAAPDARIETIHGVGHFLMLEAPLEFNAILERAVAGLLDPGQSANGDESTGG